MNCVVICCDTFRHDRFRHKVVQTPTLNRLADEGIVTGLVADTYHMFKPTQNFTRGFCSWNFIRGQEGDVVRSGPLSKVDVSPHHPEGLNDHLEWPTLTQYLLHMRNRANRAKGRDA